MRLCVVSCDVRCTGWLCDMVLGMTCGVRDGVWRVVHEMVCGVWSVVRGMACGMVDGTRDAGCGMTHGARDGVRCARWCAVRAMACRIAKGARYCASTL